MSVSPLLDLSAWRLTRLCLFFAAVVVGQMSEYEFYSRNAEGWRAGVAGMRGQPAGGRGVWRCVRERVLSPIPEWDF
ncbi:MAG TPA: hypothetical protein VER03_03685, partial [Bryobacteraceae bacterium]|nr:hypothetical protein [Bryobacteraceae bacterium]